MFGKSVKIEQLLLFHLCPPSAFPCQRSLRSLVEVVALGVVNPVKGRSSMEERYGLYRQGSRALRSMRNGDFQEGDVWDVLNRREDYNSVVGSSMESSHFSPRRPPSAARMIGRVHGNSNPIHEPRVVQQSAPVKIPDWSKIYGENSKKASSNNASWLDNNDDEGGVGDGVLNEGDDSGDDDDDETKLPPHEWLAKKYARSQISSFSVFEGVGRTLKGRDLSRVRNAVLTKTGFLE
ncbi:hypothetical protein CK203_078357 [Vitis vinifera]|uniref:Senescence regulator S40 n=1 Tax=Vitis vinifera TaxID=29760 RepID=A0A438DXU9_VITVI|nr:hypothetical protein CK203_078357 [Vitis vinifera]